MNLRLPFGAIGLLACAGLLCAEDRPPALTAKAHPAMFAAGRAVRAAENPCLACHSSFDKLVDAPSRYVAPSGEKTSPHRYIPHSSKDVADVPDCKHCHTAHPTDPLPAKGAIDLSKVGVTWCYEACHHEKNLKSCKECHP